MTTKPLIATPISHLFEDIEVGKKIAQVSDCLELRQRSVKNTSPNQWLFHVDIDITHPWNDEIRSYLRKIFDLKSELKLVTFQATRCCAGEVLVDGMFQVDGVIFSRDQMLNAASINISWLRSQLKNSISLGIENNNYYPTDAYSIVCDGDFLTEVVTSNNIYLLFDVAHAMVTAHNKKLTYFDYINTLPLERAIQLHICQPFIPLSLKEIAQDTHELPTDNMLKEVDGLLKKYKNIKYVTVEYYKEAFNLISILKQLKAIISSN